MDKEKNQGSEQEKRTLYLTVNSKKYEWPKQYITGLEIKKLGNISLNEDVFLAVTPPWEDEPIKDDSPVNLARPEIEHFYSGAKEITIIVNGTPKKWAKRQITFEEAIILAYGQYIDKPTMVYTVAYEDGPKQNQEGSMVKGSVIIVQHKMIFHVTATDKS